MNYSKWFANEPLRHFIDVCRLKICAVWETTELSQGIKNYFCLVWPWSNRNKSDNDFARESQSRKYFLLNWDFFFVFGNDDNDEDEPLIYLSSLFGSSRSQKLHLSNSPEHKNTLNWRFAVSLKDLKTCEMNFRKFQIWVELLWEAYVTTIKEEL